LALALGAAMACGSADDDAGGKDESALGLTCPDDSTVSYEQDIAPFMDKYCNSCHGSDVPAAERQGAPSDANFDTKGGILMHAYHVSIKAAAGPKGVNTEMPQGSGPKPSVEERKMLGEWLACSASLTPVED
jgi:uncharacterized membrane protein